MTQSFKASALSDAKRQARLVAILERLAAGETFKEIAPTLTSLQGTPMKLHGLTTFFYREMHEAGCRNLASFLAHAFRQGWIS